MIHNGTLNDHKKVCNYCTVHIVLFVIPFVISISILAVLLFIFIGT